MLVDVDKLLLELSDHHLGIGWSGFASCGPRGHTCSVRVFEARAWVSSRCFSHRLRWVMVLDGEGSQTFIEIQMNKLEVNRQLIQFKRCSESFGYTVKLLIRENRK